MTQLKTTITMIAALSFAAGCADVGTNALETVDRLEAAGHAVTFIDPAHEEALPEAKPAVECPSGWVDTSMIAIDCLPEADYVEKNFKGLTCATCQLSSPTSPKCGGSWTPVDAELLCAPGYIEQYNNKGTCKRCVEDDSTTCLVGGCSGQLCYDPNTDSGISTCEFKPEYACYADANCGPYGPAGSCAWEQTDALTTCIEENSGTNSSTL